MAFEIPYFDHKVDIKDSKPGVKCLLKLMKPSLDTQEMKVKLIEGGYLNQVILCKPAEESDVGEWVVVRVFGLSTMANRDDEAMGLQVAHAAGCGTPVLALFSNGMVVGYSSGVTLIYDDYLNHSVMRNVNHAVGRFHGIDIDNLTLVNAKGKISKFDKTNGFKKSVEECMRDIPENIKLSSDGNSDLKDNLRKECEFIKQSLNELDLPVSLCHHDLHNRNIMYQHSSGEVALIDYEFCGFGYEAMDCTLPVFCRTALIMADFFPEDAPPISESDQRLWHLWYLEGKASVQGRDPASITQDEVDKFEAEVNIMGIVNIFYRAILCLSMADNEEIAELGINELALGRGLYMKYIKHKDTLGECMKLYKDKFAV